MGFRSAPAVIGHRGSGSLAPENTLSAIRKAIALGLDGVELDVQMARDGCLVLLHDDQLTRTTTGAGLLRDQDWKTLSALDAGAWFSDAFIGERIPLLEEALDLIDGRLITFLEIKSPELAGPFARAIIKADAVTWTRTLSFSHEALLRVKAHCPAMVCGLAVRPPEAGPYDTGQLISRLSQHAIQLAGLFVDRLTPDLCALLHDSGIQTFTGPVDSAETARRIAACEPDFLFSNRPDLVATALL